MTKIVDKTPISKNLHTDLENFYRMFDMGHILHRVGADKEQGVSCKQILFAQRSIHANQLKNTPKQTFLFDGEKKTLLQINKLCKKRPGRSKYLLSVYVTLAHDDHENPINAKWVYVRNRNSAPVLYQ